MNKAKRTIALLLCFAMVLSYVTVHSHAADGAPNVTVDLPKTEVAAGDVIDVWLGINQMSASSVAFGFDFDNTLLNVMAIQAKDKAILNYPAEDDFGDQYTAALTATSISSKDEANASGHIGCVWASDTEVTYDAKPQVVRIRFTALKAGTIEFEMFEDSAGHDGYLGTWTYPESEPAPPECEHTSTKLVPNADGTHNVVCTNTECNHVVTENVPCSGTDDGDHTTAVKCDCGNTVTAATEHTYTQNRRGTLKSEGDCNTKAVYAVKCDYCNHESDTLTVEGEYGDHNLGTLIPSQPLVHTQTELKPSVDAHYQCTECETYFTEAMVETTLAALTGETPVHTEDPDLTTTVTTKEPTCTEEGTESVSTFCSCGYAFDVYTQPIPAVDTAHNWNTPTYSWSADGKTCTATRICKNNEEHKEEETVNTTSEVTTEADCVTSKVVTYYADFTADWAKDQSIPVAGEKNPTNHAGEQCLGPADDSELIETHHGVYCDACGEIWDEENPNEPHVAGEDGYCVCGNFELCIDFNGGKISTTPPLEGLSQEVWDSLVESMFGSYEATEWCMFGAGFSEIIIEDGMFVKDGYKLKGIAYDEDGTRLYIDEEITEPTTLYLIWEPLHVCTHDHYAYINNAEGHVSVCSCGEKLGYSEDHELGENELCVCGAWLFTMDYNGGKNSENPGKDGNKYYFEPGLVYNFAWNEEGCKEVYAKEGYVFAGYAYDAEGQNPVVNPTELSSTTTVYVAWACNHDQDVHEYTYTDNGDGTHTVKCACGETIGNPAEHDYTTGDADHTCICGAVEQITINIYWDGELKWTLTEDYGRQSSVPTGPNPTGYKFVGFAKTEGGEVFLHADEDITYTENLNLYPVFKAETFTLSFDLNGGTLADEHNELEAYVQDGKFILPGIKYGAPAEYNEFYQEGWLVKEGYHITGFEDEDGNFHSLESDDVFTMTGDTTLAVVWEVNTYTLTVNVRATGELVDLTVPYGANVLEVLAQAAEDGEIPAIGDQIRYKNVSYNGYIRTTGYSYWDEETSEWIYDLEGLTMPDADFAVDQDNDFYNGWIFYHDGNNEYVGALFILDGLTLTGWNYIEEDYDGVEGGAWYYFAEGTGDWAGCFFRAEGLTRVPYPTETINGWTYEADADALAYDPSFIDATEAWFLFDEDGKFQYNTNGDIGWYEINDANELRYMNHGMLEWHPGLIKNGDDYYYFIGDVVNGGNIAAEGDTYITRSNDVDGFTEGHIYNFAEGELSGAHGIVDGKYYENSRLMTGNGLTKLGDKFIYVRSNGYIVKSAEYYVPANDKGIVPGTYAFDQDGYLINPAPAGKDGIYWENGAWYYYENGEICYNKGLIEVTETWYDGEGTLETTAVIYVRSNGQLAMGYYYVTNMANYNGSVAIVSGTKLLFSNYGTMVDPMNGIVDGYYYQNNQIVYNAGVVEIEDGKYIYVRSNGEVVMNRNYWITNVGDTGVVAKLYSFDENGYFTPEFAADQKDGIVNGYYYENGSIAYGKGLVYLEDEDCYIYVRSNGQLATGIYWPTTTNGYDFSGRYDFGNDGKLYI